MNIKKVLLIAVQVLMLCLPFASTQVSLAADNPGVQIVNPLCTDPTGAACSPDTNPKIYDPRVILGNIIKAAMGFIGAVALLLFMYGGLKIMTSAGNSESIKRGKNVMIWAAIGIIVIFSSYGIVNFIIDKIPKS